MQFMRLTIFLVYSNRLEISIDTIYSKRASGSIPLLSIIDDGHGMTHQEIVRMTCFGHKQPEAYEPERIGRFGVGFKVSLSLYVEIFYVWLILKFDFDRCC